MLLRLEPEGVGEDVAAVSDEAAKAAVARGAAPLAPADLAGLYVAGYGPHGPEVVEICLGCRSNAVGGAHEIVATKITGDEHVPAGQQSWSATLPPAASADANAPTVELGAMLPARVQVAEVGFINARDVPATIEVRAHSTLVLKMAEGDAAGAPSAPPLLFRRCDARDLWLIDAFKSGQLLPAEACRHVLSRAGLPPDEHAPRLAGVPPSRVWARMCRNLALHARREGRDERAAFWDYVESGLDDVAEPPPERAPEEPRGLPRV